MISEWFWKEVTIGVVKRTNVPQVRRAPSDSDSARSIPIERRWPGLAGTPLVMADEVPSSERLPYVQRLLLMAVLAAKRVIGLGASYPELFQDAPSPYYPEYCRLHPASELPQDFEPGRDRLAGLAFRGPFSILTRKAGAGFELDLRHIEAQAPRAGFLPTGGVAHFSRAGEGLRTDWVELDGLRHAPGGEGWALVEKRFLTGLATHTTLIEHLIHCHMCVGESFGLAAIETLPSRHPVRVLIATFAIETLLVNGDNIDGLIKSEASNVPSYSGYTLATVNEIIRTVATNFDLRRMDPSWRGADQGTLDADFATVQAAAELFTHFRHMTQRYLHEVVKEVDAPTRAWCEAVDRYIPNGVRQLAGITDWQSLTLDQVAYVLAVLAYTSSVNHHIVADTTRDYMMAFNIMPPALTTHGYPTRGMVLEKMNSITIAGILRYKLLDEHVVLPEGAAQAIWAEFQGALNGIQARVDALPADLRRLAIHPVQIPSSIHT